MTSVVGHEDFHRAMVASNGGYMLTCSGYIIWSRRAAAMVASFSGLIVLGAFSLGLPLQDDRFLALACLFSGFMLTGGLWWGLAKNQKYITGSNVILLGTFVVVAGLALYSNLAYLLWALGLPMGIGTSANGQMGHVYWLPPTTLLYTIFSWVMLKYYGGKEQS